MKYYAVYYYTSLFDERLNRTILYASSKKKCKYLIKQLCPFAVKITVEKLREEDDINVKHCV